MLFADKENIINVTNIGLEISKSLILKNICLQISDGLTLITGQNGVGKSSLLKILGNITKPSYGAISFTNNRIRRHSSFMFQEPVFLERTVYGNLFHALKCFNSSYSNKYRSVIYHYLEKFNVKHLAESKANSLSTGEKKIVSYIRSIIVEPMIMFLDEPCAHLDMNNQKIISKHINQLSKDIPIIVVVHNNEFELYDNYKLIKINKGSVS